MGVPTAELGGVGANPLRAGETAVPYLM